LDIVKTFNDQLHLKTWYEVYLWTTTFYMKKHSKINTMTTRTTNGCGYSSHVVTVDLVPSRANPPGGANMLQCSSQTLMRFSGCRWVFSDPQVRFWCLACAERRKFQCLHCWGGDVPRCD
jgi:hypothetical protein